MKELAIYWKTKDAETVSRIRKRFHLPRVTTVNGETFARIADEDLPLLEEVARRGFVELRRKRIKYNLTKGQDNGNDRE